MRTKILGSISYVEDLGKLHFRCLLMLRIVFSHTIQVGLRIGSRLISVSPDSMSWNVGT